jgi:hypothetical protein
MVRAERPISVQGITKDVTRVTLVGTLRIVGIPVYHSPHVAANILSYAKLQDTHICTFKDEVCQAIPKGNGPILVFTNVDEHYTMDIERTMQVYATQVSDNISRYNKRQIDGAKRALQFMERLGFVSCKAAAEVVRLSSIANIGFTRADLVACQDIYVRSAAYQMGHGTQRNIKPGDDDPIPVHEAVHQELQIDTFFMFGQVFLISISTLMGLIMTTHLGPLHASTDSAKSKSKTSQALLQHIATHKAHGFTIKRVTSDGEPAVKAVRAQLEQNGASPNILGHGSDTPHAEESIRHLKNKARSTVASLPYTLPLRWAAALMAFVTHTVNMVPRSSSPGHVSAYTSSTGLISPVHIYTIVISQRQILM